MSILEGTATVVVATVMVSGIILLTGNGIADDKKTETGSAHTVSSESLNKIITSEKSDSEQLSKGLIAVSTPAPPPGPFLNEDLVARKALSAPVAPEAPISLLKQPKQRAQLTDLKMAPSLSSRQAPLQAAMPKFEAIAPIIPNNLDKELEVISADKPIWMQKGNINSKGPNSSKNTTQTMIGMPNVAWANKSSVQQYIYVPVPLVPSNMLPPQMPVFNGNIISPSNYWGAMGANKAPNIEIEKGLTEGVSAPMEKGNK